MLDIPEVVEVSRRKKPKAAQTPAYRWVSGGECGLLHLTHGYRQGSHNTTLNPECKYALLVLCSWTLIKALTLSQGRSLSEAEYTETFLTPKSSCIVLYLSSHGGWMWDADVASLYLYVSDETFLLPDEISSLQLHNSCFNYAGYGARKRLKWTCR